MHAQGLTTMKIKEKNRQDVLRFIIDHGTTSRQEIAAGLGISMPTVLDNINQLEEIGLVTETGQFSSTGGRKAAMISVVQQARLALGIDITKHHIGLVAVDLCGDILEHRRISVPYSNEESYYRQLGGLAQDFLQKFSIEKKNFIGTGISFPGILDESGTRIMDSHVLGIRNVGCELLFANLPGPCVIMNDANAAGLGELSRMPLCDAIVYLSLSNSVGGAIFYDHKLFGGANQRGGEFGHMRVMPGGRRCYCGQEGCFDAYCNARQLEELGDGSLEGFFVKLHAADTRCGAVWKDYLKWLAVFVVNLRMSFDCDIIMGGYVGAFLEPWLPQLKEQVVGLNPFEETADFLHTCFYRYEASAFGAAMQMIQKSFENI